MNVSRVFLSSTFSDFVWERETLNLEIVPEINAALAAKGRRIDLLDLRWGVSREAGLDNFAVDICLNEIRRSAVSGARPFFMYLGSTRAGWKPCPRVLSRDRYEVLLNALSQDAGGSELIARLYTPDQNFREPSYVLRSRRNFEAPDGDTWERAEEKLCNLVADNRGRLPEDLVRDFLTPVTIKEVELGLDLVESDPKRLAAMWREERGTFFSHLTSSANPKGNGGGEEWEMHVSNAFRDAGVTLEHLVRNGPKDKAYRTKFAEWAREKLLRAAADESEETKSFHDRARPGLAGDVPMVQRECLAPVQKAMEATDRRPRMLYGSSGCGKSVLVNQLAARISDNGGECLVLRPGRERQRLDLQAFLELVWDTLGAEGPISDERASAGKGPSAEGLREYLAQPRDRVLTLFVDGIDECDWRDSAEAVSWIPLSAGEGLTLIVSTSAPALRSSFEDVFGAENLLDLPELSASETRSAIDLNLRSAGRQLQDGQWASILEGLDQMDGKAVATRLAATIGRTVPAEAELPRFTSTLSAWTAHWLEHLDKGEGHGRPLVETIMAVLVCCRRSVPERALFDAVKGNHDVLAWLRGAFPDAGDIAELPRTAFSRLMGSIDGVLEASQVDGELHFALIHTALKSAIAKQLPPLRLGEARERLATLYAEQFSSLADLSNATRHLLSEVLYQAIACGSQQQVERLVAQPAFAASKTGSETIGDTLEEIGLARANDWLGSEILEAFARLVRQERHNLARLAEVQERRAFVAQRIAREFDSNPLRSHYASPGWSAANTRLLLRTPRVPGLAILDATLHQQRNYAVAVGDNLITGQADGSLAIVDAHDGQLRARLSGHEMIEGLERVGETGRILAWGKDGQISLTSVPGARELKRLDFGTEGRLRMVVGLAGGGVLAIGGDPLQISVWDGMGERQSLTPVTMENVEAFAISNTGMQRSRPWPSDKLATSLLDQGRINSFNLRSDIVALNSDLIVFHGLVSLVVWSVSQCKPIMVLNQATAPEWWPRFVRPDGDSFVLVSQGGGVARIKLDGSHPEILAKATMIGGADQLDDTRIFTSRVVNRSIVETSILNLESLTMGRAAHWEGLVGKGYFRKCDSSMARGVVALGHKILAWCADGSTILDLSTGQALEQESGDGLAFALRPGVTIGKDAAILINAERPELHTVDGARPVSLDHLLPRVSDCIDLGEGRALIRSPDGRAAFWNAAETVSWLGESVDADGATGILHRGNGALLANGELVIQKPDPADPTVEFSHYRETEGELALVSAQRGAWKPKPPAAPGSMEAMLPSLDRPFSHWQTLGDMVLSYSGTPARVALSDSGHEAGRWWMPLATTLTQMVTSADPDLGPYFPNLAYIASDGSHLIGATLGNGNFPTGKLPVKEEVHRLIVDRGAIMAVFGQGVERMIPRSSLLANLDCIPLFDLASLLPEGNKGSIQQVAWLSNVGVGLALVNQGGTGSSRQLMAIAFCSHRGVLSQSLLPFSGPAIPAPSGFLFQDESGPRLVGFDEEAMKIDIGPAEKQIRLPVPLRETMEKIHGASEGGLRWSLSSHQDIDYRLDFDQFCVQLQSDRIVIDTLDAAQGQQPDVVLFPSGYRIIDAIEHGGEGSILVRAEELLQVIRFNGSGERGRTGTTTYVAAERLFLHRMGLTELAAKLPAPSLTNGKMFSKERHRLQILEHGAAEIEILLWQGNVEKAEAEHLILEGIVFDDAGRNSRRHEQAEYGVHRLAAMLHQAKGNMSFSEYLVSRSLRTNEKDLGKLVPAFVEGLIFFALCGQLDAAAVFPGLLEELRSSGHDIDSDPFVADLAILAAAEVDRDASPAEKQNASQGDQSIRRSGADRAHDSQASKAAREEGRPPGQGRFLAAMGAVQRGDAVKAREHLEVAVQEGSFYAAHILGKMWLDGVFGKSSSELALSLFQRAAIAGLPEGIEDFWRTLATFKPGEVYKKSQRSAQQSHQKGDPIGSVNFAASQFLAPNADQEQQAAGIALMKRAASQGSASAAELLRKWGGGA
ncbi:MAG: hypothetical protein ACI8QU_001433 [Devosia litorisediminis]|jgi:hypothetical protein